MRVHVCVCVCVRICCVRARARARVCVCVCVLVIFNIYISKIFLTQLQIELSNLTCDNVFTNLSFNIKTIKLRLETSLECPVYRFIFVYSILNKDKMIPGAHW